MCKGFVLAYRVHGLFTVGRFDYEVVKSKCLCETCVCGGRGGVRAVKYLRNNFEKLISERVEIRSQGL